MLATHNITRLHAKMSEVVGVLAEYEPTCLRTVDPKNHKTCQKGCQRKPQVRSARLHSRKLGEDKAQCGEEGARRPIYEA